jgi:anti-sigma factor RsiW
VSETLQTVEASDGDAPAAHPCLDVAAYLDGELDPASAARFEGHAKTCAPCTATLAEQRRLLCVLDAAFGRAERQLTLPANFTEVVKARAQSDMSSVRRGCEGRRALLYSAALAALAFALLGRQAWDALFAPLRATAGILVTLLDMTANTASEAASGLALMLGVLGGQMLEEPGALSVVVYVMFAVAVGLLFRLIVRYHRTPRLPD